MATEVWHELGPVPGACTVCATDGRLTMGEVRMRASLRERMRHDPVAGPARLVTCSSCGWRWTVRVTDTPVTAAAAVTARTGVDDPAPTTVFDRREAVPAPRPAAPPSTSVTFDVPPCPRDRRPARSRVH